MAEDPPRAAASRCLPRFAGHGPAQPAAPEPARGRGVSSPSHDRHPASGLTSPRARPRARSLLGRPSRTARKPARAGQLGRPGRGRGAGRVAQEAIDQEGRKAVGAPTRDLDDGSDHARRKGHARQGRGLCVKAMQPRPTIRRSVCCRGVCLPDADCRRQGGPCAARRSRSPAWPPGFRRARPSATSSSPRLALRSKPAPTRSTWSSIATRSLSGD